MTRLVRFVLLMLALSAHLPGVTPETWHTLKGDVFECNCDLKTHEAILAARARHKPDYLEWAIKYCGYNPNDNTTLGFSTGFDYRSNDEHYNIYYKEWAVFHTYKLYIEKKIKNRRKWHHAFGLRFLRHPVYPFIYKGFLLTIVGVQNDEETPSLDRLELRDAKTGKVSHELKIPLGKGDRGYPSYVYSTWPFVSEDWLFVCVNAGSFTGFSLTPTTIVDHRVMDLRPYLIQKP